MSDRFLTVGWEPVKNAGVPFKDPSDPPTPFLAVAYQPKNGPTYYPYGDDLAQGEAILP